MLARVFFSGRQQIRLQRNTKTVRILLFSGKGNLENTIAYNYRYMVCKFTKKSFLFFTSRKFRVTGSGLRRTHDLPVESEDSKSTDTWKER